MQFLDLAGVRSLWDAIKVETAKSKTTVEGESAHATNAYVSVDGAAVTGEGSDGHVNYVVAIHNAASTTDVTNAINTLKGDATSTGDTLGKLEDRVESLETGASVTIQEAADPGAYAKVYNFTQNGKSIGSVNIPKDFLVKSGQVRETTAEDTDYEVGTKVLDFVVNTLDGAGQASHIIIPVEDLVDVYTGGNGIDVSPANVISAVVDPASESYLTVGENGLKVSGVSTAISDAVNAAKTELKGTKAEGDTTAETIRGAKDYADALVAAKNVTAEGDSYVSATAANNKVTVAATQSTKDSLALADSALQGVDDTPAGTNVKVTLGTNGKNVTVSVVETGLTDALAEKADKVDSATAGNFAGLDANGNLTDSGSKAADFATAAQGAKADTAIQGVTGETAVANSNYVAVSVEAAEDENTHEVTLSSHANVTTQAVAGAAVGTADGLATAADVKKYVDDAVAGITGTIADLDADLDASGTAQNGGIFVMSGVTQVDGLLTKVDSTEVERAGAAAAAEARLRGNTSDPKYSASETLTTLRTAIDAMGGDAGSIAQQIQTEINKLDSDVNAATATTTHISSTNTNTTTNAAATPVANVLTSLTITDGKISAATGETIGAIPASELQAIFNPTPNPGE